MAFVSIALRIDANHGSDFEIGAGAMLFHSTNCIYRRKTMETKFGSIGPFHASVGFSKERGKTDTMQIGPKS